MSLINIRGYFLIYEIIVWSIIVHGVDSKPYHPIVSSAHGGRICSCIVCILLYSLPLASGHENTLYNFQPICYRQCNMYTMKDNTSKSSI